MFCPGDCDITGDSKAKGLGIHPEDGSICKSAIADGAMPLTGGVVGVGSYIGLKQYDKGVGKVNGVEVGGGKMASKSFSVVKIDNIDMADLDLRILDYSG